MMPVRSEQKVCFTHTFPAIRENELMSAHTYLKIGGPAAMYLVAETADRLLQAIGLALEIGVPYAVIGGGSNVLVSDAGFQGIVLQAADRTQHIEATHVSAAAGVFTGSLARAAVAAGLTGFEWGIGVPGTIGGAVYGNAGCFGGEMKDVVVSVDAYDVTRRQRVNYTNAECRFGYRDSRFKHEPHCILSVTMDLHEGDAVAAKAAMDAIAEKRKESQPQGSFSAGCLFKNPTDSSSQQRVSAGALIDKLGLKGTTIGKAQISPVHGNFLVNLGGARAQDVIALSSLVKMKVRDELGILLEDEVQYLGF